MRRWNVCFFRLFGLSGQTRVLNKSLHLIAVILMVFITGCADLVKPSPFSETNIDRLCIGMHATEVRELFGVPNEVRTLTCGGATSKTWICETWTYRSVRYKTNDFTFSVEGGYKLLNNWNVSINWKWRSLIGCVEQREAHRSRPMRLVSRHIL